MTCAPFMLSRYSKDDLTETELQNHQSPTADSGLLLYSGNRETFWLVNEGFDLMRDDMSQVALHIEYIDFGESQQQHFQGGQPVFRAGRASAPSRLTGVHQWYP